MSAQRSIGLVSFLAGSAAMIAALRLASVPGDWRRYGLICLALALFFLPQVIHAIRARSRGRAGGTLQGRHGGSIDQGTEEDSRGEEAHWTLPLILIFSVISILLYLPPPLKFLQDQDWAHQLAGANQILKGGHPFVDYLVTYGPLTYYGSAVAQFLSGTRVLGEILLVVLGYSIAYTILYWMTWSITRDRVLSFGFLVILIVLIPRLYKYFIVLWPALSLFLIWRYLEHPSRGRVWLVGLSVVVTGLFRPDFGGYMALCALAGILFREDIRTRQKLIDSASFLVIVLLIAMPWLIWLALRGGLQDYFYASTVGAVVQGIGMALPVSVAPDPLSTRNLKFIARAVLSLLPALSLIWIVWRKRTISPQTWLKLLTLFLAAQFTQVQGMHRPDWAHLLQGIPLTLVLLAYWVKQVQLSLEVKHPAAALVGLGAVIALLAAMLFFSLPGWRNISVQKAVNNLKVYSQRRDAFTSQMIRRNPQNDLLKAMDLIRKCTRPGDRIVAWPYLTDFYYFTGRPFGAGMMALGPGHFTSPYYQDATVRLMQAEKIPFYIYAPQKFTENSQRIDDYAPIIARYLEEAYVPYREFGDITIFVDREQQSAVRCAGSD